MTVCFGRTQLNLQTLTLRLDKFVQSCYFYTMRTKKQGSFSFIKQARRAQIIAYAIETIAEVGYAQASLAQIGQRAKISKGVITYHFVSKEALMQAVVNDVLGRFATFVTARVTDNQPWEAIRTFLQANADFLKAHRAHLLTLFEIIHHARDIILNRATHTEDIERLAQVLRQGQQQGMFRPFDVRIMATSILALRDSIITQSAKDSDIDIDQYVQEIIGLIDHAVRQAS
ncbi:MAG: TetR/AcrR family transcriptional regulator [Blastochloris sp.]|nr:TetR/AcrR family transcriptional regulator [Blastochloris sp.]